ncbi:hypothetical protein SDC9_179989 [bioreactor metagenome]|uniref:Uncharacterized protein n=1 Tax=bioreactor metagenome TaxID=1076179 RepID=A0A645H1H1_9ZZZZ
MNGRDGAHGIADDLCVIEAVLERVHAVLLRFPRDVHRLHLVIFESVKPVFAGRAVQAEVGRSDRIVFGRFDRFMHFINHVHS